MPIYLGTTILTSEKITVIEKFDSLDDARIAQEERSSEVLHPQQCWVTIKFVTLATGQYSRETLISTDKIVHYSQSIFELSEVEVRANILAEIKIH